MSVVPFAILFFFLFSMVEIGNSGRNPMSFLDVVRPKLQKKKISRYVLGCCCAEEENQN